MAILNLRKVPDELAFALRVEALSVGMTVKEYCVAVLELRGNLGPGMKELIQRRRRGRGGEREEREEGEAQKKIAESLEGGGAREGGGPPEKALPAVGKAQQYVDARFREVFRGVKLNIGLKAQGHLETVERLRSEGRSWDEVGEAIGWAGKAVEEWYGIECAPASEGGIGEDIDRADQEAYLGKKSAEEIGAEFASEMIENLRESGRRREALKMPEWSEERMRELAEAEPGGLMACSPEILGHMLEDAKTDQATAYKLHLAGVELDREIITRWKLMGEPVSTLAAMLDRWAAKEGPDWINVCRHALADAEEVAGISEEAAKIFHSRGVPLSREILVRWGLAENYKPKLEGVDGVEGRSAAGKAKRGSRRSAAAVPAGDDGAQSGEVGVGKPEVGDGSGKVKGDNWDGDGGNGVHHARGQKTGNDKDGIPQASNSESSGSSGGIGGGTVNREALKEICAGNVSSVYETFKIDNPGLYEHIPDAEIPICGEKFYNEVDGENYICGKDKHGPKVKHGDWIKA